MLEVSIEAENDKRAGWTLGQNDKRAGWTLGQNDKGQGGHWGKMTKDRVETAGVGQNEDWGKMTKDRVETRGVGQNDQRAGWRLKDWGKMTKAQKLHSLLARQGRGSLAGQACKKRAMEHTRLQYLFASDIKMYRGISLGDFP